MAEPHPVPAQSLTAAREGIYEIRRQLEAIKPALATDTRDAINSARLELCGALVHRLEIAEHEIQELIDMLDLGRKR